MGLVLITYWLNLIIKKMKYLNIIILLITVNFSTAQLYINVEQANQINSVDLQLDSNNKGIGMPIVNLVSVDNYSPIRELPKDGLLVYNNNVTDDLQIGYYYWKSSPSPHWEKAGGENTRSTIIQNIDEYVLGYSPQGNGTSSPSNFTADAGTFAKSRCVKWDIADGGNGHSYCAYTRSNSRAASFEYVYNAARAAGGYIVTITSNAEWDFVKNNVIYDGLSRGGSNLLDDMYIGYTSVATPGNRVKEYMWITGETWDSNWANSSNTQSQFASIALNGTANPEPATENYSRCSYIAAASVNANRQWYTRSCSTGATNVIIEFNQ
jgi:hypothetical protein